jgi:hypothetical protein
MQQIIIDKAAELPSGMKCALQKVTCGNCFETFVESHFRLQSTSIRR